MTLYELYSVLMSYFALWLTHYALYKCLNWYRIIWIETWVENWIENWIDLKSWNWMKSWDTQRFTSPMPRVFIFFASVCSTLFMFGRSCVKLHWQKRVLALGTYFTFNTWFNSAALFGVFADRRLQLPSPPQAAPPYLSSFPPSHFLLPSFAHLMNRKCGVPAMRTAEGRGH